MAIDTSYDVELLKESILDVQDFPKPGVLFRDVTPLLAKPNLLQIAVKEMIAPWRGKFDVVAGIESRGFVFAAVAAASTGLGLQILRKTGKLPPPVYRQSYLLEYGEDALEIKRGTLPMGSRVLVMDDVLATGGTAAAASDLLRQAGAKVVGAAFLIDLTFLPGRETLSRRDVEVTSVLQY